jgi:hypothetical protein
MYEYAYYIVTILVVAVVSVVAVALYFSRTKAPPSGNLTRVERLIKEQASSPTTERYENTNETVPNAKMLELYERMFTVLPPALKELLDCNTARSNRSHMYSLVACILSKIKWWRMTPPSTSDQNNPITEEQFHELLVILIWIRFMIEHDLSDIVQILTYEPQVSGTNGAIKIVHPQFKEFLEVALARKRNPERGATSISTVEAQGKAEWLERATAGLAINTIKIQEFVSLILEFSSSLASDGYTGYNAKCGCDYDEKASAASALLAREARVALLESEQRAA